MTQPNSQIALTKPVVYESKRIRLTSRALHIGSEAQKLSPFEYVVTDKFVYLPDTDALAKALQAKGDRYLEAYVQQIEQRRGIVLLLEEALGENWQQATSPDGRIVFPKQRRSLRQTDQTITDLRPMIRNGFGQIYIPGSSIKGAIRTAIAYHLIKHADRYKIPQLQRISEIERKLRQSMGNLRQQAKFIDDRLFMDTLFSDFGFLYQGQEIQTRFGPNTDFMRAVKVSDSEPLILKEVKLKSGKVRRDNISTVVEILVTSRLPDYKAKYRASIYAEIVRGVNIEFTLSLDAELLSWFKHTQGMEIPFQSVDDILQICQNFAQEQWDFEHDYWAELQSNPNTQGRSLELEEIRQIYEPETCPYSLRLGWGSGMNGTTIGLNLDDQLRSQVRDTVGLKAPGFEAPKSRRIIVDQYRKLKLVPGWIKLIAL